MTELDAQQQNIDLHRAKKRSCIVRMIMMWLFIGAVVILAIIYFRSKVVRDSVQIQAYLDDNYNMALPEGFFPYSMNNFMGVFLVSFWDKANVREDGRSKNVLSIFSKSDWHGKKLEQVLEDALDSLPKLLAKNEFHTEEKSVETVELDGEQITIYRFKGQANLDDVLVNATTSFRYMLGPQGPVQLQALGPEETFPESVQLTTLASFKALRPQGNVNQQR